MVEFNELKAYRSSWDGQYSIGGAITATQIQSGTPNNLFFNIPRNEVIPGTTQYACVFFKNTSAETMENCKLWLSAGTPLSYTGINWAFDGTTNPFDGAVHLADSIDDYINCGNHSDLWSKPLNKFSFCIDVYPTNAVWDGSYRRIVQHNGGSAQGFELYLDAYSWHNIGFQIRDSSGGQHVVTSDDCIEYEWNRVVCSYDATVGGPNLKIWVNGVRGDGYKTGENFTQTINNSAELRLGDSSDDLEGLIRDFRFWDDQSINDVEALELQEDINGFGSPLAYHLDFNERTGSTTKDRVSKTKTATLTNGTIWRVDAEAVSDPWIAPRNITKGWYASGETDTGTFKLKPGQYFPIWLRLRVEPDSAAKSVVDDNCVFTFKFDIAADAGTGSTGSGGSEGGTGANPVPVSENWKLAVAGDWGNTGDTTDVLNIIKNQNYNLVLGVGDNAYDDSSASKWKEKFNFLKDKMESAFGNHEYEEDGGISPYKSFFGYSKTYNSIRWQNCLILILDTNDDKSGVDLDAQKTWARNELEKYKNDQKVVWRIACMHHPWFGDGGKHDENEFDQVQKFHKLFIDYDVNFVYTGHNHNWQRTHQVGYNNSDPRNPNVVDSSSPYSRAGNGLIYIVSGTGGHDGPGDFYSLPDSKIGSFAYRNKSHNGVHELVASNSGRTLTGRFRDVDNKTYDTFTITA